MMINPARYIAFVDTLNELEQKAKKVNGYGLAMEQGEALSKDFAHYSVQWDSEANRWTLVAESDEAPDLCSFNQTADECSGLDRCEQCQQVAEMLEDQHDADMARRGL